jgi:hypothetical protein
LFLLEQRNQAKENERLFQGVLYNNRRRGCVLSGDMTVCKLNPCSPSLFRTGILHMGSVDLTGIHKPENFTNDEVTVIFLGVVLENHQHLNGVSQSCKDQELQIKADVF